MQEVRRAGGAAAAATTALTVAVVPDSQADKDRDELLRLLADIRPFGTDPQAIPDLTGGFGTTVYDLSEGGASQFRNLCHSLREPQIRTSLASTSSRRGRFSAC